ncbi:MAG: hypothetical protein DBX55_10080 [Verrucomicrobia bacterium]|nr:MAG: hypothetical protein DBX55_10080 [Verrucomicrobiota bacterium]
MCFLRVILFGFYFCLLSRVQNIFLLSKVAAAFVAGGFFAKKIFGLIQSIPLRNAAVRRLCRIMRRFGNAAIRQCGVAVIWRFDEAVGRYAGNLSFVKRRACGGGRG